MKKLHLGMLLSHCDIANGQSGGPVTTTELQNGNYQVVAVDQGSDLYDNKAVLLRNSILSDPEKFREWVNEFQRKRGKAPVPPYAQSSVLPSPTDRLQ